MSHPEAPEKRCLDSDDLEVINAMFKDNFARVHEDIRHLSGMVRNLDQCMERVAGHIYTLLSEVKDIQHTLRYLSQNGKQMPGDAPLPRGLGLGLAIK